MVMGADYEYPIGSIVRLPFHDAFMKRQEPQPFLIVRKATKEEWEADVLGNGGTPHPPEGYAYYYHVETD